MTAVLARAQRGPGPVDTGDRDITGSLGAPPNTNTNYLITALMQAADAADPTVRLTGLTFYLDGQPVWGPSDWQCPVTDRNGTVVVPNTFFSDGRVHATFRVTVTLSKRMNFGVDISPGTVTR